MDLILHGLFPPPRHHPWCTYRALGGVSTRVRALRAGVEAGLDFIVGMQWAHELPHSKLMLGKHGVVSWGIWGSI